jgi:hypothetical protein
MPNCQCRVCGYEAFVTVVPLPCPQCEEPGFSRSPKADVEVIATWVETIGKRLRAGGYGSSEDSLYKYFADEIRCEFGVGCRCGDCQHFGKPSEYKCEVGLGQTPHRNMATDRHPQGCPGFEQRGARLRR